MKLIFCSECWDVFKLARHVRSCECGKCNGQYEEDGLNAWYTGESAIPLGFANNSLATACMEQPLEGWGKTFNAFVIPKICPTMEKKTFDNLE